MNFSFSPMSAICGAHFILDLIPRYYYASSTNHEAPHIAIFPVMPLLPHTLPHIRQLADGLSPQRLRFDPRLTHVGCGVQSGTGTRFLYEPFGLPLSLSFHLRFIPISVYLQPKARSTMFSNTRSRCFPICNTYIWRESSSIILVYLLQ